MRLDLPLTATVWNEPHATDVKCVPTSAESRRGINKSSLSPCPNWPYSPLPHVYTLPLSNSSALWLKPHETAFHCATLLPSRNAIRCGACLSSRSPRPSWPWLPAPNTHSPLSVKIMLCDQPHARDLTRTWPSSVIAVGTVRGSVSPRPSWPWSFAPHAYTVPLSVWLLLVTWRWNSCNGWHTIHGNSVFATACNVRDVDRWQRGHLLRRESKSTC